LPLIYQGQEIALQLDESEEAFLAAVSGPGADTPEMREKAKAFAAELEAIAAPQLEKGRSALISQYTWCNILQP
jgi:hypothetical protein